MFNAVILNQGMILLSKGHLAKLETYLVVRVGYKDGGECPWPIGRGQEYCKTFCNAQDSPVQHQSILAPNVHGAKTEKLWHNGT